MRADIRNPIIGKVIARADVDTVVHMSRHRDAGLGRQPGDDERDQRHRHDAAARGVPEGAERAQARREVVDVGLRRRRRAIRRCSPRTLEPQAPAPLGLRQGLGRGRGLRPRFRPAAARRHRLHPAVRELHRADGATPPLTSYFSLPVVPTVLGFDPRLQFVHEDDGLDALRRATVGDHPGTFNVAGDGVLTLSPGGPPRRPRRSCRCLRPPSPGRAGAAPARARRLHARADPLPDLRPGRRHRRGCEDVLASSRATPPRRRSRTSSRSGVARSAVAATTSMPSSSVLAMSWVRWRAVADARVIPIGSERPRRTSTAADAVAAGARAPRASAPGGVRQVRCSTSAATPAAGAEPAPDALNARRRAPAGRTPAQRLPRPSRPAPLTTRAPRRPLGAEGPAPTGAQGRRRSRVRAPAHHRRLRGRRLRLRPRAHRPGAARADAPALRARGSGSRCAGWRTCPPRAVRSSWPTTPARSRSTR